MDTVVVMLLDNLLTPYRAQLSPPTEDERTARAPIHTTLRVTDDYLRVYAAGVLALDLAQDLPVAADKKDLIPRWAWDISVWDAANMLDEDDELPVVLNSVMYLVASTYGGKYITQISRGTHRGKLALIENASAFQFKECTVPAAPIEDDAAADAYLAQISSERVFRILPSTYEEFVALRLMNAAAR